ncbi:nucleolin [Hyalella azteca]|uniref:Nucleolin n=1 Tax=Hyalella azteca TaxID=294128 RepID=A0A8B7NI72_HYAAZ|nr:nucleolin [Hyalella azteca]
MQTPGGSSRPARRCGRPKRFDDSDSDDAASQSASKRVAASKRRIMMQDSDDETPAKRQRILTSKVLSFRPSFQPSTRDKINWAAARKRRPAPKSSSGKWPQRNAKNADGSTDDDEEGDEDDEEGNLEDDERENNEGEENMEDNGQEDEEEEDTNDEGEMNAEEELESMLSEYREMFGKAVTVDMSKENAIANGNVEQAKEELKENQKAKHECENCVAQKEEIEHLEEMIKLKDVEMQQILATVNSAKSMGQKFPTSLSENIKKRISYHKLYLEAEKKMHSSLIDSKKWEAKHIAAAKRVKELEQKCEALELKLKSEMKKQAHKTPGFVEVPAAKMKEFIEIKNFHYKNCNKMHNKLEHLSKENATVVQTLQRSEQEFKNKFLRMKKHYNMLLEYYLQKDARLSKRKDFLDKKMAVYKDVGSRHQILRDAAKYLNENQLVFLSGQLSTEKNLTGKGNCLPSNYRELLLSIFQRSSTAYKVLKSFGFNFPPVLSIQQLAQSEAVRPSEGSYAMLGMKSRPVPAHKRTLRALCSDEEDEEIADLLDASTAQHNQSIVTDEEAEDGVDGDYGDVQPEEINEEEEEEGGADYLSDDEPKFPSKLKEAQTAAAGGDELQQEYQTDIQEQLDNQLSSELTAEPQFETVEADGVMSDHSLAEQVDVMEQVVRRVTDVVQLESLDPIQTDQIQEQIEIDDSLAGPDEAATVVDGTAVVVTTTDSVTVPAVGANDVVVSDIQLPSAAAEPDVAVATNVDAPVTSPEVPENIEIAAETQDDESAL